MNRPLPMSDSQFVKTKISDQAISGTLPVVFSLTEVYCLKMFVTKCKVAGARSSRFEDYSECVRLYFQSHFPFSPLASSLSDFRPAITSFIHLNSIRRRVQNMKLCINCGLQLSPPSCDFFSPYV